MRIRSKSLLPLLVLISTLSPAQNNWYDYRRELTHITEEWQKIEIPEEVFGKIQHNFSDLRIFGVDAQGDTIEAPYVLTVRKDKIEEHEIKFNLINESTKGGDAYFTFETSDNPTINEIELEFEQKNFDWRIKLTGSQDQQHWFDIVDDYRILSIQNEVTDYHFTRILFPPSNYPFYQIRIYGEDQPGIIKAYMLMKEIIEGNSKNYEVKSFRQTEDKKTRQTIIDLKISRSVPVRKVKLNIEGGYDFYRLLTIQYLSDSFETEKGWKYRYTTLSNGILTSLEDRGFSFNNTILDNLHLVIDNYDNEPLKINSCEVEGFVYELTVRFSEKAAYWLVYGNTDVNKPNYDIAHFAEQIPDTLAYAQLGEEQVIEHGQTQKRLSLFENKAWLWGMLILIIAILGYFAIAMIRKG